MHTRLWMFLALLEAALVCLAVYYEPTCCVRGRLWNEAVYDGHPTSYWRRELLQWEVSEDLGGWMGYKSRRFQRHPTWFENVRAEWLPAKEETEEEPMASFIRVLQMQKHGPPILRSDDEGAKAVLRELLDDPEPRIRRLARIGLDLPQED